jgi:hypothetical protein
MHLHAHGADLSGPPPSVSLVHARRVIEVAMHAAGKRQFLQLHLANLGV